MDGAPAKKRGRPPKNREVTIQVGAPIEVTRGRGRPSKYEDWVTDALLDYFSKGVGDFPTLAGFAGKLGVSRDTLHEWANGKNADGTLKHSEFSDAYKRAKELQEQNLVTGALSGVYNATFAIFTAKNILGWRDKIEQEVTGKDGSPLAGIQVMFVNPDGTERNAEH